MVYELSSSEDEQDEPAQEEEAAEEGASVATAIVVPKIKSAALKRNKEVFAGQERAKFRDDDVRTYRCQTHAVSLLFTVYSQGSFLHV